jgi:serine phosphatase RsbU (regulator of sigma subunit)
MANKITDMLPPDVQASDTLYIVDKDLRVVYTNDEWSRFASQNKGERILGPGWNSSLLENMSGKEKERWKHIYRLLLEGRVPHHQESFICSSPVEKRIYQLRITPRKDDRGDVAWLVHHTMRIDERQDVVARLGERLSDLDDPVRVAEEYRRRVIRRKITIPSFRAARHFKPLEDTGGDLLWHREFPQGVTDFAHADAMGHGTGSARLATQIVLILDEVADADAEPGTAVSALNRAMVELAPDDDVVFATGLFFRFDQRGHQLTCSNFGHLGPIFSRTGQVYIEGGPPIGLVDEAEPWPVTQIDMAEHGHRFLVFSDGITEQFNLDGEMFGTDRLLQAFRENLRLPLDEMVDKILAELTDFRSSALVKDDQTLLALEFVANDDDQATP